MSKRLLKTLTIVAAAVVVVWLVLRFSPYPELQEFLSRPNSVRYYDRNGILLQITPLADGLRREIPLEIPRHVKDVFVFAEDRRFYRHGGVDVFAVFRAMTQNIQQGRRVSGASTITMQLARLISNNANSGQPPRRQNMGSKIAEAFNAKRLEARLSKDKILELYLNSLPFGHNAEGVASAARNIFSTDISMLSPAQIFCLAVIPRRPSLYSPLENPEAGMAAAMALQARFSNNRRLNTAWPLLVQITEGDWEFAVSSARRFQYPFEFPHLIRSINAHPPVSAALYGEVHLSVDLALQRFLEDAIAANVALHHSSRMTNGAALVINNDTGEILAWVGSADFFNDEDAGQIDGVLALNQPGSSLKPFLYAMALENGFKPTDVIADIRMVFGIDEIYIPQNFNERFNGPMLFRASLASSLNIPAVYLLYRLGVRNYTQKLFSLGFDSLEHSAEHAGLGLALGNAPVSLLEQVRAFSVFPRDGIFLPLTWNVVNSHNASAGKTGQRIFSADTSRIICSMLSDANARFLAFGAGRSFRTQFPSMFKTGTANQFQSIVALGATPRYSAGVWMGNFTGETVIGRTGSSVPAVIARNALTFLHGQYSPEFLLPEYWQKRRICAVSGMPPSEACLAVISEFVYPQAEENPCTWHFLINGRTETIFPAEFQAWFTAAARGGFVDHSSRQLEIVSPRDGFAFLSRPGLGRDEIPVEVIGGTEDVLRVTHNGNSFDVERPFIFFLPRLPGNNFLQVQAGGEETAIMFTVE